MPSRIIRRKTHGRRNSPQNSPVAEGQNQQLEIADKRRFGDTRAVNQQIDAPENLVYAPRGKPRSARAGGVGAPNRTPCSFTPKSALISLWGDLFAALSALNNKRPPRGILLLPSHGKNAPGSPASIMTTATYSCFFLASDGLSKYSPALISCSTGPQRVRCREIPLHADHRSAKLLCPSSRRFCSATLPTRRSRIAPYLAQFTPRAAARRSVRHDNG